MRLSDVVLPPVVYALCALASLVCSLLLWRSYHRSHHRFLFLVGVGFAGLTLHNLLLFVDLVLLDSGIDLSLVRSAIGLGTMALLLFVLIWEDRA
jgi:hypothetical protein